MACFQPPFNGAEPSLTDGCGFCGPASPPLVPTPVTQSGSVTLQQAQDRVTIVLPTPLTLGHAYEIQVWTENLKTGDPDQQIYPTVLVSRNNNGVNEIGFTYLLNSPPTTGPGTFGPNGVSLNSYTLFQWSITYTP